MSSYVKFIVKFITTGYAIPGAVIGFSIMMVIRYFDSQLTFLMGSMYLLIYAYIFRFISVAIFPIQSSLERQPKIFDKQSIIRVGEVFWKTLPTSCPQVFDTFVEHLRNVQC